VLVNAIPVHVVQMAVMQVIHVAFMSHRGVPATWSMPMAMARVLSFY
jgi:hypothetical protein